MDLNKKLSESLLKADGIDPAGITDLEREAFRQILDKEKRRLKRLHRLTLAGVWSYVLVLLGLCFSEKLLDTLHIPFIAASFAVVATPWILKFTYFRKHLYDTKQTSRRVRRLEFLVNGKFSGPGLPLVGRKGHRKIIYWANVLLLTSVLWLLLWLGIAAVNYLLCGQWTSVFSEVNIFMSSFMSVSFIIGILIEAYKTPLDQLIQTNDNNTPIPPDWGFWRKFMSNKITRTSIAAAVFLAVLLGIHLLPDNNSQVFAHVMDSVFEADSVRYKWTFQSEKSEFTNTVMINRLGIQRVELPHGDIMLFDRVAGSDLHLMPQSRQAILTRKIGQIVSRHPFSYLDWVSRLHKQNAEYIGQENCLGRNYDIYMIYNPYDETKIWVDPKTDLPFRIVMENYPNSDPAIQAPEMHLTTHDFGATGNTIQSIGGTISSSRGSSYGIQERQTIVYSDFEWNIALDDSLFSFDIPEGYELREQHQDVSGKKEIGLVEAFSFWTEMNDGLFPDDINDLADPEKAKPLLIKKYDKNGDPEEEMMTAWKQMTGLLQAVYFVQERKVDGTWHYAGQGVILGDVDTPVCWWKEPDAEEYTVIYGNLSIGTLAEEQLPQ